MVGAQYGSNILPAGQRVFDCWRLQCENFLSPQVACCVALQRNDQAASEQCCAPYTRVLVGKHTI